MPYFKDIQNIIISEIKNAKKNLKISVTWFTNHDIFNEIIKKTVKSNFKVELIVLNDRINNKKVGVNFQKLIDNKCDFYYSSNDNMVHNKFCIIDNEKVITGSYNWTYYAENRNWENIVIINDKFQVEAYIKEFDKITSNHTKVKKVIDSQTQVVNDYVEYLKSDYHYQAICEAKKGNDLTEAKIYTELLKIDEKQPDIINARKNIIEKYNSDTYEVSPFEIGILYENGYRMVIPAFVKLPFTISKKGKTSADNQEEVMVIIQKFGIKARTILTLYLKNIQKSPKNTVKINHILKLEKSGKLSVSITELNGGTAIVEGKTHLKRWL